MTTQDGTVKTIVLLGLGGVGKTRLAREFAERHREDYRCIFWIDAEEPSSLLAQYAKIATLLDLPAKNLPEQSETIQHVLRWFESNKEWLIIFDNVIGPGDLADYIPKAGKGHILITSRYAERRSEWFVFAQTLDVGVMTIEDAVHFLHLYTGDKDTQSARLVAKALGCLPLAMAHAAAYVVNHRTSLAEYERLFQKHRLRLLKREVVDDYAFTIATTWEMALKEIGMSSPQSVQFLNLCAYLAADDIPLTLLRDARDMMPALLRQHAEDELDWHDCVMPLCRYSLLTLDSGNASVHRLVQEVVRERLSASDQADCITAAIRTIAALFPDNAGSASGWARCQLLVTHALSAVQHVRPGIEVPDAADLLVRVGRYYTDRALYQEAERVFQTAITR